MKLLKLMFFGCLLLMIYKHHSQILGVVPSIRQSRGQTQENIQKLEEQIEFQRNKTTALYDLMQKVPAAGTVVGHLPCGAKIIVGNTDTSRIQAEASQAQAEIECLEQKLRAERERLAGYRSSQP